MMTFRAPKGSHQGGVCWCCRRHDDGIAYIHPTRNGPVWFWSCHDHIHLAKKAAHMPRKELDEYEQEAMLRAGRKAGAYLDTIGKTDLATLTRIEWVTFLRLNLDTFGQSLAELIESHEVPF